MKELLIVVLVAAAIVVTVQFVFDYDVSGDVPNRRTVPTTGTRTGAARELCVQQVAIRRGRQ
jgi:hypothetical protein